MRFHPFAKKKTYLLISYAQHCLFQEQVTIDISIERNPQKSWIYRQNTVNALNSDEKQEILDLLHNEIFIDKTPYDVYYNLMDKGEYYCSPRTMYRILAAAGEATDRRAQRNHRDAVKPS